EKTKEVLSGQEADVVFTQFSSPKEVGNTSGYQLRQAPYVLAIQQVDGYIDQLLEVVKGRQTYSEENWAIFVVSTHGGTETGVSSNNTEEERKVPMIFSGSELDNRQLLVTNMAAKENADNF